MAKRILIVDDDRLTRRSLELHLNQAGYACRSAGTVAEALLLAATASPELILLDIGLPDVDGLDGLRLFRAQLPAVPIIFVTGRRRTVEEIVGLEVGADDYITKPFDVDILAARIKAVLRRGAAGVQPPQAQVTVGDLCVDLPARVATLHGTSLELTPRAFDLLYYLACNAGRVASVGEILDNVWGAQWVGEEQTVYVHIRWLRTRIERDAARPERLLTVRGIGYKLVAPATGAAA